MQWPERVIHDLSTQSDKIGLTFSDDIFCLLRTDYHAYCHAL